jgi:ubiquitin-conjugating enzyme E2 D/E
MSVRRLNKEMKTYPDTGPIQFRGLIDDDITKQQWRIKPSGGRDIKVLVQVPHEYPFKAPKVTLVDNLFHPNVHDSKMCLDKLTSWAPKYTIPDIMEEVLSVLIVPNLSTALNQEAADMYVSDHVAYQARVAAAQPEN